jgi:hypothetical protein
MQRYVGILVSCAVLPLGSVASHAADAAEQRRYAIDPQTGSAVVECA